MTILPAGNPAWARTAGFDTYGGHLEKRDYGGIGAVNALTDITAAQYCRLASDAAAVTRTAPLLTVMLSRSVSTITVVYAAPLWVVPSLIAYDGAAAQTGYPSAVLTDTNEVTLTLPTTADDEFGVAQAIVPRICLPCAAGVSWDGIVSATNDLVLVGFTDSSVVPVQVW